MRSVSEPSANAFFFTAHTPEDVEVLQGALDDAWGEVLASRPFLALLGPSGGQSRERLAIAILEGARAGLCSRVELREFALLCIPKVRIGSRTGA